MDATWYYSISLSGFLSIALWDMLFGRKIHKLVILLPVAMVFIGMGVLSLKWVDVIPEPTQSIFRWITVIMSLVGGISMLSRAQSGEENNGH